jgi:hypothetical protein
MSASRRRVTATLWADRYGEISVYNHSWNDAVSIEQQMLRGCYGKSIAWDGKFGANTRAAMSQVQKSVNRYIASDGYYGPVTHNWIKHIKKGGGACYCDRYTT